MKKIYKINILEPIFIFIWFFSMSINYNFERRQNIQTAFCKYLLTPDLSTCWFFFQIDLNSFYLMLPMLLSLLFVNDFPYARGQTDHSSTVGWLNQGFQKVYMGTGPLVRLWTFFCWEAHQDHEMKIRFCLVFLCTVLKQYWSLILQSNAFKIDGIFHFQKSHHQGRGFDDVIFLSLRDSRCNSIY